MGKSTKAKGGRGTGPRATEAVKARMLNMVLNTTQDYATIGQLCGGFSSGTVFYHCGGRKAALKTQAGKAQFRANKASSQKRKVTTAARHRNASAAA